MKLPHLSSQQIVDLRPHVDRPAPGERPLHVLLEQEPANHNAALAQVMTILLRGSECPFRCLMCDLWKSTHTVPTRPGDLPKQINYALANPPAQLVTQSEPHRNRCQRWVKLYNASNFFSPVNVPREDLAEIADQLTAFDRVVVENHPKLTNQAVQQFANRLSGRLEVAMGLETVHPEVLPALNKQMTLNDFRVAAERLAEWHVDLRTFVLLRPPGLSETEGIEWCLRSIEFAVACGTRHVSVIAVRGGNGAMELLQRQGHYAPPLASSLERVLAESLVRWPTVIVTVDLWDWQRLQGLCDKCSDARLQRLEQANLGQQVSILNSCVGLPDCACPKPER